MKNPKVTVVMAAHNGEAFLKAAMESILSQTYEDLELLIVNDGSVDETLNIVHGFNDSRIRLLNNEQNRGIVYTRNRGLREAKGDFVAILDCDDIAFPGRIDLQVQHLLENPDLAMSGGHAEVIDAGGEPTGEYYRMPTLPPEVSTALLFRNPFVNSSLMFRKEFIKRLGGYKDIGLSEDYELAFRISKYYQVDNLDKVLIQYRVHGHNISSEKEALMKQGEEHVVRYMQQSLGIPPDDQLLKTHLSFIRAFPENAFELQDYWNLFAALNSGNDKKAIFPKEQLNKVLLMKWYELIRQSKTRSSLALFFRKPLFKMSHTRPKMYRKMIKQALGF